MEEQGINQEEVNSEEVAEEIAQEVASSVNDQSGIEVKQDADSTSDSSSCLLYTSPSPRDATLSRMPSSA